MKQHKNVARPFSVVLIMALLLSVTSCSAGRQQWEYKHLLLTYTADLASPSEESTLQCVSRHRISDEAKGFDTLLDAMGKESWELVLTDVEQKSGYSDYTLLFKRPK